MTEDYSIPRNLTGSLFKDFELPEHSIIQPKHNARPPESNIHQSKYRQAEDEDFINLQLGQQSVIARKGVESNSSNNSISTTHTNVQDDKKPRSKIVVGKRARKNNKTKKPKAEEKKQVNIDEEVGEVGEWAQRAAKNSSDQDDFDAHQAVGQTDEQMQIRKRLEDKLKNGFQHKPAGGGLAAKAEQMKREREKAQLGSNQKLLDSKRPSPAPNSNHETHETSAGLMAKNVKGKQRAIGQESQDDPWDKVNQKTIQHYQNRKQKQKTMTLDLLLKFYKEEFQFDQTDIEIQEVQQNAYQQNKDKDAGCLEMLFSCFKAGEKKKPKKKNNFAVAKRLAAIAKKQLSNTEEEFFMLQQIWTKLTSEPFSRYGGHWNQLGFQGRDPATDLRSTGVLSLLQWLLFISDHEKQAGKYAVWSIENEYPLALTHIKITGVFLDLLLRGILQGQEWQDFQSAYNALAMGMLKRMKSQFKGGENIGTLVEEQARKIKQSFTKELASYDAQYRK